MYMLLCSHVNAGTFTIFPCGISCLYLRCNRSIHNEEGLRKSKPDNLYMTRLQYSNEKVLTDEFSTDFH